MANTQRSICCSQRQVAEFLTSPSFLRLWLIQQDLAYKHRQLEWNSGHPELLFSASLLKFPTCLDLPYPLERELSPALTPLHSLDMSVCVYSKLCVCGRHSPVQIKYCWYFLPHLLQCFLSEQKYHFSWKFYYSSYCLEDLWSQSWVDLKHHTRQQCRNKLQFQRLIPSIYSLRWHCSHVWAISLLCVKPYQRLHV